MKHLLLTLIFSFLLGFGIFTAVTTPAKANVLCWIGCVNQVDDWLLNCLTNCGQGSIGSMFCRTDCRRVADTMRKECGRLCNPCPI